MSKIHVNPDGTWGDDFVEVDTSKWHEGDFTTLDFCYDGDRLDLAQAITAYAEAGRPAIKETDDEGETIDWGDALIAWWYDQQHPKFVGHTSEHALDSGRVQPDGDKHFCWLCDEWFAKSN